MRRLFIAVLCSLFLNMPAFANEEKNPHKEKGHITVRVVGCGSNHEIRVTNQGRVDLCAEVRVQPHEDHRYMIVTWDYAERVGPIAPTFDSAPLDATLSQMAAAQDMEALSAEELMDGAVGSTEDDLDGASERVRVRPQGHKMDGLKGGTYEIVARVYSDTSHRSVSCSGRTTVQVR